MLAILGDQLLPIVWVERSQDDGSIIKVGGLAFEYINTLKKQFNFT